MSARKGTLGVVSALLAAALLAGCGPGKYVPKANEEIYGTWTNDKITPQKVVNGPDGWKNYTYISDTVPLDEGTRQVDRKWVDSDGNIWYRAFTTVTSGSYKGWKTENLQKLSKSATVLELVDVFVSTFDPASFPTRIDPKDGSYRIYYRAEK